MHTELENVDDGEIKRMEIEIRELEKESGRLAFVVVGDVKQSKSGKLQS